MYHDLVSWADVDLTPSGCKELLLTVLREAGPVAIEVGLHLLLHDVDTLIESGLHFDPRVGLEPSDVVDRHTEPCVRWQLPVSELLLRRRIVLWSIDIMHLGDGVLVL